MRKYEYTNMRIHYDPYAGLDLEALDKYGADGWVVVSVTKYDEYEHMVLFCRELRVSVVGVGS